MLSSKSCASRRRRAGAALGLSRIGPSGKVVVRGLDGTAEGRVGLADLGCEARARSAGEREERILCAGVDRSVNEVQRARGETDRSANHRERFDRGAELMPQYIGWSEPCFESSVRCTLVCSHFENQAYDRRGS